MDWVLASKWLGAGLSAIAIYGSTGIIIGYLTLEGYDNARAVYYTIKALREFLATQRSDTQTIDSSIYYDIYTSYVEPLAIQTVRMVDPNISYVVEPIIQVVFNDTYVNNVTIYYGICLLVFT